MAKPEDTIEAKKPESDFDDPLAELARIVSAGSVFGDVSRPPQAEQQPAPVVPPPVVEAPEPQIAAPVEPVLAEPEPEMVAPVVEPAPPAMEPVAPVTPEIIPQPEPLPEPDLETLLGNELEAELAQQFEQEMALSEPVPQPSIVEDAPPIAPEVSEPQAVVPEVPQQQNVTPDPIVPQVDLSFFEGELAPDPAPAPPPVPEDVMTVPERSPEPEAVYQPAPPAPEPAPVETFETAEEPVDDDPISSFIEGEINKAQRDMESDADLALRELAAIASPAPQPEPAVEPQPAPVVPDPAAQSAAALEAALLLDGFEEVSQKKEPAASPMASVDVMSPNAADPTVKPDIDFGAFEAELSLDPSPGKDANPADPVRDFFHDPAQSAMGGAHPNAQVQPAPHDEFEHLNEAPAEEAGKNKGRALLVVVAVLVLTLVGSVVYLILGLTSESDTPLIVTADENPVRVRPEDPGGKVIPNQDNPVFDRLSNGDRQSENESILLRDDADGPLLVDRNASTSNDSGSAGVSATTPNLGPKKVRTVVIRTDGTPVIPSEDEVRSTVSETTNEAAGLAARNTPLPPAISSNDGSLADNAGNVADNLSLRGTNSPDQPSSSVAELPPVQDVADSPVADNQSPAVVAALPPLPRPNTVISRQPQVQTTTPPADTSSTPLALQAGNQANPAPSQTQAAATAPTTPPAAADSNGFSAPSSGIGNFLVQLSSQRTEAQAQRTFDTLARRYSFLSTYSPNIRRVDLGDRGVYHRVRIGPFSRAEAARLCTELKARGGDCILAANR